MQAFQPLILIAVFLLFFYFLAVRPQKRRQQELQRIRASLKPGDQIITVFGMYGTVTEVEDTETVLIEISEDTEIRIASSAISTIVPDPDAPATDTLPTTAE